MDNLEPQRTDFKVFLLLIIIIIFGASLRIQAISNTIVYDPVRMDAKQYYFAALNLAHWGVFSKSPPGDLPPEPDAYLPPGLPVAITPFVEFPPSDGMLFRFNAYQALLGMLTIIATYALFRLLAGGAVALIAALLVAVSPHLVSMTTYLLTETQFTFLLIFGMLALAWGISRERLVWAVVGGLLLGLSALTRATTEYLPLFMAPFLLWAMGTRLFLRIGLPALGSALAVIVAWKIRNFCTVGAVSDPTLFVTTLLHGIYPDFMFNNIPETYENPYAYDPFAMQPHTTGEVISEVLRRTSEHPLDYAYWYLIGKPISLLSYNMIVGMGGIFVYPVIASPYFDSPLFQMTEALSSWLHAPLTVSALVGCGVILFRPRILGLDKGEQRIAILLVALILYFLAVHMVGAPFPRYGIPLRPIVYGLGLFTLVKLVKIILLRISSSRAKAKIHG